MRQLSRRNHLKGEMRLPPNETPRPSPAAGTRLRRVQKAFDEAVLRARRALTEIRRRERANRLTGGAAVAIVAATGVFAAAAMCGDLVSPTVAFILTAAVGVATIGGIFFSAPWIWSWQFGRGRHQLELIGRDIADAGEDVQSEFEIARCALGLYEVNSAQAQAKMHEAACEQLYQRGALEGLKHAEQAAEERERLRVDLWRLQVITGSLIACFVAAASLFVG